MSLKEQMLKAGLIDEAQAKRASHETRRVQKKTPHNKREQQTRQSKEEAAQQAKAQREQDRLREQERQAAQQKSTGQTERSNIRQTVFRDGLLANWQGPKRYHFVEQGRVEFIDVSDTVLEKLSQGRAAIARRPNKGQQYEVITRAAGDLLREAMPEYLVLLHD